MRLQGPLQTLAFIAAKPDVEDRADRRLCKPGRKLPAAKSGVDSGPVQRTPVRHLVRNQDAY